MARSDKLGGSGKVFSATKWALDRKIDFKIDSPPFETDEDIDIYLNQYKLVCLECGEKHVNLGKHITKEHAPIDSRSYKEKYNIPYSRALIGIQMLQKCKDAAKQRMKNQKYREDFAVNTLKAHAKTRSLKGIKKENEYCTKRRIAKGTESKLKITHPKYLEALKLSVDSGISITKAAELMDGITQPGLSTYIKTHPHDTELLNLYKQALKNKNYKIFTDEESQKGREIRRLQQKAITHCPKGHPYSGKNLYITKKGARSCKECTREAKRRFRIKQKLSILNKKKD